MASPVPGGLFSAQSDLQFRGALLLHVLEQFHQELNEQSHPRQLALTRPVHDADGR